MSELQKSFLKKEQKKTEHQCQNAAYEPETTSEKRNFGSNQRLGLE